MPRSSLIKYAEDAEFYGNKAAEECDFKHAAKVYLEAASYWEAAAKQVHDQRHTAFLDHAQQDRLLAKAYAGLIGSKVKA
jgi:hypothetical protein